ncbi:MAG: hypothetical protein HC856_00395 [Pseudanabaena sp. RU_4_16]|nr:hypothetical protein [Pseudanabaena sp. SU_2_4]NJM27099.1 hypothetical protein [Pseudanabaena sp. RU_4_16]
MCAANSTTRLVAKSQIKFREYLTLLAIAGLFVSTMGKNQFHSQLAPQLPLPDAIELDLAAIDLLV